MRLSQIAINSVTTKHAGLEEALDAYAGAGFKNIEFVLTLVKDWLAAGQSVADVRAQLAARELRSIGGFQTHVVAFGDADTRSSNHAIHLGNARLIHELGGGTLVVGTDGPPQMSVDALPVLADVLRGLVVQMEGLNVSMAIEFNWSPLVKSFHSAVRVAELVDHKQFGVLWDPAHYYTTVTKLDDLKPEWVRWIKHVHIDDMRDQPGELSNCNADRVLPGQGVIDLPDMIGRLERGGYNGFYSIELFNDEIWRLPAAEAARQCFQSMHALCTDI